MKCSWFGVKPNYNDIDCDCFEDKDGSNNNSIKKNIKKKEEDKTQKIIQSKGEAYKIAYNMLINGSKTKHEVVDDLVHRGISTDDAEYIVIDALSRLKKYKIRILFRTLLCIILFIYMFFVNKTEILYIVGGFVFALLLLIVAIVGRKQSDWENYEPTLRQNLAKNDSKEKSSHISVDLGLPSGTLWATCNVGADRSEGYGKYYAWGRAVARNEHDGDLLDAKNIDTAAANWGGKWRMPTDEECYELIMNCKKEWVKQNGVSGCRFTGSNGNSIFMPAAGYYRVVTTERDVEVVYKGSLGSYWTSTSRSFDVCYMFFDSGSCDTLFTENADEEWRMVRPVCK